MFGEEEALASTDLPNANIQVVSRLCTYRHQTDGAPDLCHHTAALGMSDQCPTHNLANVAQPRGNAYLQRLSVSGCIYLRGPTMQQAGGTGLCFLARVETGGRQ